MNIPIISLDKIFIKPDEKDIFFLDCTRINGTNKLISRRKETIEKQILRISKELNNNEIILADDVVYSGNVLKIIINMLNKQNIKVVRVIASISSNESYYYFNNNLKYGIESNYIMSDEVIDQICERDFYFGIAGSGIMIDTNNGLYKAPYFKPYGNPNKRASIPKEYEICFSKNCLERSTYLWEEIDKMKEKSTKISELPEKIINTNENEEVVKTLKKEIKRI